ncbi:hypothetical protein B0H11DRAFT_2216366 [Mycena galericulata]|nr:hypothetical protein B0H11DRAFT_2216366 [Mycena galericulata]
MSTTFLDLPPELIFRILELSVRVYMLPLYCKPQDEYPHLCTTALVCKAWTAPSQILLWRYVSLRSELQAERWVNSPATSQYTTAGLWMYGRVVDSGGARTWGSSLVKTVLSRAAGLKALEIVFFEPITAECLALPCLKDLTTLVVSNSAVSVAGPLKFPFRLRLFKTMQSDIQSPVVEELFRSSASTLECLDLAQQHAMNSSTLPGLYQGFPSVATSIRVLRMTNAYAVLVPHLAGCTGLSRLHLAYEMAPDLVTGILNVLPAPLEDLYVEAGRWGGGFMVLRSVIDALDCLSLSRLERLHIPDDLFTDLNLNATWGSQKSMRGIITARGIALLAVSY